MARVAVSVLLLLVAGASGLPSLVATGTESRPVSKVITMLKDMLGQLNKEAEEDGDVFEQINCWCTSNDREKTKAISDAESHIKGLTTLIQDLTSTSSKLNTEIASLEAEVAKNEQALDTSTSLRKKQLAEFNEEEKDMLQSITSMKGAVTALEKHNKAAFLQSSDKESLLMGASSAIQHQLSKHAALLSEVITPKQRRALTALQSGAPPSAEIFGVISGMKEQFENNLAQSQREETDNNNAYEDMKAAKTSEIAAGQSQSEIKTQQLADADEKNALSKQDLEDTSNTLEADIEFLATVKTQCKDLDAQFAERTKTRQLEIEAVNKALSYLTSDDAHDLFTRTFNMAFVQKQSVSEQRVVLSKLLLEAAKKSGDPKLSHMAIQTRVMKFDAITMALERMVSPLEKEQKEEVEKRDYCIAELNTNEASTAAKGREHADTQAKVDDAKMTIDELTKSIDELKQMIKDTHTEFKRAGEDREMANKEFQVTVADQRATQKLLRGAKRALEKVYSAALMQTTAKAGEKKNSPAPAFKTYDRSKGGIVGVIQGVLDDARKLEAEAIRGEEDAQKAYEDFTKDTNDALVVMNRDLVNKQQSRAKTTEEKAQHDAELANIIEEEKHLAGAKTDLHASCDYTLKNFDVRQAARHDEIESLKMAIHITGGAPLKEFLQTQ